MSSKTFHFVILTPVYNDWVSLELLLKNISIIFKQSNFEISVLVVDDGSNENGNIINNYKLFKEITIIRSSENRGHQRAIATGLTFVEKNIRTDAVVVLDSDGEDRPEDIPVLLKKLIQNKESIVFAARSKRSESIAIKIFYFLYTTIFRLLTGKRICFGNFSIIPEILIHELVSQPNIWNHYAASIIRSGLSYTTVSIPRGTRYSGISKMNFIALVIHGLSSISIFLDKIINKLIIVEILLLAFTIFGFLNVRILLIVTLFFITLFIVLRKLKKRSYYFSDFGNDLDNLITNVERY